MSPRRPLVTIANARIPSQRAQSLQVVQMAAAFQRAGAPTTLLHARRRPTPPLPAGQDLWDYYAVGPGERPAVEAVSCADWIDRVPRPLQYLPARLQELSFARNAARRASSLPPATRVYAREVEAARHLVRAAHPAVFLEVHRVPGGRARRRWLREAAAGCRGVVAISEGVHEDLLHAGVAAGERLLVEHDGYEPRRFAAPPSREEARRRLGLGSDAEVAVYTGGLLPWKGVDVLVEAAALRPEVQFLIVGGMDADVAALRKRVEGSRNVRVEGFRPPEEVVTYLAAADVGLVPNRSSPAISSRYTSPLKIFEALAVGLPLVASNLASIREILQLKKTTVGVLTAPDSAKALARALRGLLDDPARREAIRAQALELAPRFTWDARAERLLDWMDARS